MGNNYLEMKERHRHAINNFPISFAFNREQLQDGMKKLGLSPDETDKVVSVGGGGFIRKNDIEAFVQLNVDMAKEFLDLIEKDTTGKGFICEMFEYELANHEIASRTTSNQRSGRSCYL
jgi:hypothetical protein